MKWVPQFYHGGYTAVIFAVYIYIIYIYTYIILLSSSVLEGMPILFFSFHESPIVVSVKEKLISPMMELLLGV